jgi:PKHD-type hydroxylase
MLIVIADVLDGAQRTALTRDLGRMQFSDGASTAGWAARSVKRNAQADADPLVDLWRERIATILAANETFRIAAQPKRIIGPMLTRYRPGDEYGPHVDDAILDGTRADLAFTLFLSPPETYDGGSLVIDGPGGEDAHRLHAGSMVLYPATTLHRVEPVTRGVRYAAVGWVRSYLRSAEQREILFDLERARRMVSEKHGKTTEFDLLSKTAVNLMRMWAED